MTEQDDRIIDIDESGEIARPEAEGVVDIAVLDKTTHSDARSAGPVYLILPIIFMAVTLLGGMRLASNDNSLIFLKPALICLVFASVTLVLFFRAKLISIDGWFSESLPVLQNGANGAVLIAMFAATVQLYNSLLPEQGLPMWIVGFCFFWTLWNNLFADFDTKRLLRSLGALFALAFVVKFLILAHLTAPEETSWLRRMIENPGREAFTWLLDLPRYGSGTGYIQFFTLALYFIGLYLTPNTTKK